MAVDNGIFDRYADTWWVEEGTLHALKTSLNPGRFGYFRRMLTERLGLTGIGATVLDVGCGGGFLAEEFARLGCRVTGIDPSWRSLEVAHLHAQREGLDITYRWGRAERLPAADDAYDIVVCCDVLEHVDDPAAAVAELVRVLRPGGVLFFDTINRTAASKLLVIKLMQEWRTTASPEPLQRVRVVPVAHLVPRDLDVERARLAR